jgi:putative lipoic acid-binding regulatory protein
MPVVLSSDGPTPELNFPCEYPVKVIGRDEDDFLGFVVELISRHVPDLPLEKYTTHTSSGGKYLSVSVTFIAQSRAQVDALYQELGNHKRIKVSM